MKFLASKAWLFCVVFRARSSFARLSETIASCMSWRARRSALSIDTRICPTVTRSPSRTCTCETSPATLDFTIACRTGRTEPDTGITRPRFCGASVAISFTESSNILFASGFFSSLFADVARQATSEPMATAVERPATVSFTQPLRLRMDPVTRPAEGVRLNSMTAFG